MLIDVISILLLMINDCFTAMYSNAILCILLLILHIMIYHFYVMIY